MKNKRPKKAQSSWQTDQDTYENRKWGSKQGILKPDARETARQPSLRATISDSLLVQAFRNRHRATQQNSEKERTEKLALERVEMTHRISKRPRTCVRAKNCCLPLVYHWSSACTAVNVYLAEMIFSEISTNHISVGMQSCCQRRFCRSWSVPYKEQVLSFRKTWPWCLFISMETMVDVSRFKKIFFSKKGFGTEVGTFTI